MSAFTQYRSPAPTSPPRSAPRCLRSSSMFRWREPSSLAITFWIAVAAVVERYHYTIDVVLGSLVALAVYLAWRAELTPSALFTALAISLAAPL